VTVISISLPDALVEKLDKLVEERGYYSRSEAIRDALRSLVSEAEIAREVHDKAAGVIMVTCPYERKDVDYKITKIRHEFDDVVVENVHRHVGNRYCIEIFIVEGETSRILSVLGRLRGMRGVYQVKSILLPL